MANKTVGKPTVAAGLPRDMRVHTNAALEAATATPVAPIPNTLTAIAGSLGISPDDAESLLRAAVAAKKAAEDKARNDAANAALLTCDARLVADRKARLARRDLLVSAGVPLYAANNFTGVPQYGYADFESIGADGERIAFNGVPLNAVVALAPAAVQQPRAPRASNGAANGLQEPWRAVKPHTADVIATFDISKTGTRPGTKSAAMWTLVQTGMTLGALCKHPQCPLPQSTVMRDVARAVTKGAITLQRR